MLEIQMYPDEINLISQIVDNLHDNAKIVEWGSGGSTMLFLSKLKPNQKLISIEHNQTWFDKVDQETKDNPKRSQLTQVFIPLDADLWGYGIPSEENPCFTNNYTNPEKSHDVSIFDADLILVDGIARGACLATVRSKLSNNKAIVLLHDYSDGKHSSSFIRTEWYQWAVNLYSGVEVTNTLALLSL